MVLLRLVIVPGDSKGAQVLRNRFLHFGRHRLHHQQSKGASDAVQVQARKRIVNVRVLAVYKQPFLACGACVRVWVPAQTRAHTHATHDGRTRMQHTHLRATPTSIQPHTNARPLTMAISVSSRLSNSALMDLASLKPISSRGCMTCGLISRWI